MNCYFFNRIRDFFDEESNVLPVITVFDKYPLVPEFILMEDSFFPEA